MTEYSNQESQGESRRVVANSPGVSKRRGDPNVIKNRGGRGKGKHFSLRKVKLKIGGKIDSDSGRNREYETLILF